jgi:hypothetical protein
MSRVFIFNLLAYLVPTFLLGYLWHLKLFARVYQRLAIYRDNIIIPFGFTAILLQGGIFAWAYPRLVAAPQALSSGLGFAAALAVLSWTFTTLAVGAKHHMGSVPRFLRIETGFTVVQFLIVGPLLALSSRF